MEGGWGGLEVGYPSLITQLEHRALYDTHSVELGMTRLSTSFLEASMMGPPGVEGRGAG